MAGLAEARFVAEDRGVSRQLDGFVVGACFAPGEEVAQFALEGAVLRAEGGEWQETALPATVLCIAPDVRPGGVLVGCEDGTLRRLAAQEADAQVRSFGRRWVEQLATHGAGRDGIVACAAGRELHLLDAELATRRTLAHPSTVTGIAFDARGKRVAASHYNGASVWFTASRDGQARVLEWKGSHIGVAVHPAGESVVTAMQESALHGWRLADGQHMRMSGYPAKPKSLGFTRSGRWLASAGADAVVLWPFFGGGPMGKPPNEMAQGGAICTHVACHPAEEMLAAGYADGMVVLADVASGRVLPILPPGAAPVSALAWSASGATLAAGTEAGLAVVVDLSRS